MREKAVSVKLDAPYQVDTCGTGGDMSHTFNISTTAAFVVAGAGVTVAKHGNRSVSSKSGSADVLQALGVNIEMPSHRVEECLKEVGIAFLFAPMMHLAMKYAIGPRREVGIRTIFNVLGPLTNPAGATSQLIGVYDGGLTSRALSASDPVRKYAHAPSLPTMRPPPSSAPAAHAPGSREPALTRSVTSLGPGRLASSSFSARASGAKRRLKPTWRKAPRPPGKKVAGACC